MKPGLRHTNEGKRIDEANLPPNYEINISLLHCKVAEKTQRGFARVMSMEHHPSAICGLSIAEEGDYRLIGSAFFIAHGLAVSAKHVVDDHIDRFIKNDIRIILVGHLDEETLCLWRVNSINHQEDSDIVILSVEFCSDLPPSPMNLSGLKISTRIPQVGEEVFVAGFRELSNHYDENLLWYAVYGCAGPVLATHPHGRDKIFLTDSSFEVDGISIGGMSGGPVLDRHGYVIGVLSSGMNFSEGGGVLGISCIHTILDRVISPHWPFKEELEACAIKNLNNLSIEGIEHYISNPDGGYTLSQWQYPSST